ncbi:MAG: hypothetical protein KF743_14195 [Fimbriimonadaceae bacterium]|nr:hypothetical protein [Fimbriimonadaceae bacterium]
MIASLLLLGGCTNWRTYRGDGVLKPYSDNSKSIGKVRLAALTFDAAGSQRYRLAGLPKGRYFIGFTELVGFDDLRRGPARIQMSLLHAGVVVASCDATINEREWWLAGEYLINVRMHTLYLDGREYELILQWADIAPTSSKPAGVLEVVKMGDWVL